MAFNSFGKLAPSALEKAIAGLLGNPAYSDLTIKIGDAEFRVHRAIVAPQSSFFKAACSGPWKENQEGVIELHDDSLKAVEAMIRFLYARCYHSDENYGSFLRLPEEAVMERINFELEMFALGEKYDIPHLREFASSNVVCMSGSKPSLVWKIGFWRNVYGRMGNVAEFVELRKRLLSHASDKFQYIPKLEDWRKLMVEFPEMGYEMWVWAMEQLRSPAQKR